eukprot:m.124517 g.124517  ORF g.124517 m.124517 type:complete len:158 (+) comp19745_c0_seq6:103-576(+)
MAINKLIIAGVAGVTALFVIIALATKGWVQNDGGRVEYNIGLFELEIKTSGGTKTVKVEDYDDKTKERAQATAAFLFIALFSLLAAAAGAFVNKMVAIAGGAIASFSLLIATGTGGSLKQEIEDNFPGSFKLGYSFALCVVAMVLAFVTTGLATQLE